MEKSKIQTGASTATDDINLWHRIFHNKIVSEIRAYEAQIAAYESEKDAYERLKDAVKALNDEVDSCALSLGTTYEYTKKGISSGVFDNKIDKINEYKTNMNDIYNSLNDVISDINTKISDINDDINNAYAQIRTLKSQIGI